MSANSSGEIELVYECDTERFHRYKGLNDNKEVTVYLERWKITGTQLPHFNPPPHKIKAIIRIDEHPSERGFVSRNYEQVQAGFYEAMRNAGRAAALKEIDTYRKESIKLLTEIRDALKGTKINPRRSAKKRS